jgi:hypothetical protein
MNLKINDFYRTLFAALIILFFSSGLYSQKEENDKKLKDKLWYGINVGNIGISSNYLDINLSLMGGYKLTKSINAGLIVHGFYSYFWNPGSGNNKSYFDYGFGALSTVKIYRNFYAQVEIDKMFIDRISVLDPNENNSFLFTYVGGGYKYSSSSDWSMTVTLLYNVNPESNLVIAPLDYRVAFVYNF